MMKSLEKKAFLEGFREEFEKNAGKLYEIASFLEDLNSVVPAILGGGVGAAELLRSKPKTPADVLRASGIGLGTGELPSKLNNE